VLAVARDLLRMEPGLTAPALTAQFVERVRRDRASAYVLAGSLVGYVFEHHGAAGVHALWRSGTVAAPAPLWSTDGVTLPWRSYVERAAAAEQGVAPAALARSGCG
jgi:hypothetical protein